MSKEPLVSISVVTYNSSEFVLETLESAKTQTYKNIELVVSDDCSTDNTVEVVEKWIKNNKSRFVRTRLLTVEKNTGVSGNAKRAINACEGEWIKGIAGDDILLPTCVEDNLRFISEHPSAEIVLSNSIVFFDTNRKEEIQKPGLTVRVFFELSASEQYEQLVRHDILLNPNSQFTSKRLFQTFQYDENFRFMEDRPFFWNCTSNGVKLYYLDKNTVRYRKHQGALTGISGMRLISLSYYDSWTAFYFIVRKPEMEKRGLDVSKEEKRILWYLFVKYVLHNKGNVVTRFINKCVNKWIL